MANTSAEASMMRHNGGEIAVNGRTYALPRRPTIVICADGCDPAYIEHGLASGFLPAIAGFRKTGFVGTADAVMPTFTNPNNMSIVTGVTPAVHGIAGNYYLDRTTGNEVMITDGSLLRVPTVLGALSDSGVRVVAITAKDKLRRMLGHGLRGICFSAERADECTMPEHGIEHVEALVGRPKPRQYSADLSLFVLDAGLKLLDRDPRPDVLYLSLSDFVQHSCGPGEREADAFHAAVDERLSAFVSRGAVIGLVADHGMNAKTEPDGTPRIVYLEDELAAHFGPGAVRVICPITDPFVRHHGALGSFVRIYIQGHGVAPDAVTNVVAALPGIERVLDADAAAREFDLPRDMEGDLVVLGDRNTVIGARREDHDLSGLAGHRLRSHGGRWEQRVPFIVSHPLNPAYAARAIAPNLHNYDIFDFVLNGVAEA
jgi:phosphonoacetate hydrolase